MPEQLLYTWADRGLEGRGRLQVVAASRGLLASSAHQRLARQLCRYDVPSGVSDEGQLGELPVSYGWLDLHGARFAFRRTYLGCDPYGRPGVFAAHVLVGDRASLPAARLLRLATSATWWSGEELVPGGEPSWGPISLDDFEDGGPIAPSAAAEAVAAVLLGHQGRPVRICLPAGEVLGSLAVVADVVPHLVDQLSISSYEREGPASWFSLSGTGDRTPRADAVTAEQVMRAPALVRHRAAAALLVRRPTSVSSIAIRRQWPMSAEPVAGRDAFVNRCAVLWAVHGSEPLTVESILPALHEAGIALDVLEHTPAQQVLAQAVAAGDQRVQSGLAGLERSIPLDVWANLGRFLAGAADRSGESRAAETWLAGRPAEAIRSYAVERLSRAEMDEPTDVAEMLTDWPTELLAEAAAFTEHLRSPQARDAVIAEGAGRVQVLARLGVPALILVRILARALQARMLTDQAAGDVLLQRPDAARACENELSAAELTGIVRALPAEGAVRLLGELPWRLHAASAAETSRAVLARLDPADRWRVVVALSDRMRWCSGWPDLLLENLIIRVRTELADPAEEHGRDDFSRVLSMARDPRLRQWNQLIRELFQRTGRRGHERLVRVLSECLDVVGIEHAPTLAAYAMDVRIAAATAPVQIERIFTTLSDVYAFEREGEGSIALKSALRSLYRGSPDAALAALQWAGAYAGGGLPLKRGRSLEPEWLHDLAQRVVDELAIQNRWWDSRREFRAALTHSCPDPGAHWLTALAKQAAAPARIR